MYKKQVVLEIESVYTANAFSVASEYYVGAGSETEPEVYLYDIKTQSVPFNWNFPSFQKNLPLKYRKTRMDTINSERLEFEWFNLAVSSVLLHRHRAYNLSHRNISNSP